MSKEKNIIVMASSGAERFLKSNPAAFKKASSGKVILQESCVGETPDEILLYISTVGITVRTAISDYNRFISIWCNKTNVCNTGIGSEPLWPDGSRAEFHPPIGVGAAAYLCSAALQGRTVISFGIPIHLAAHFSATAATRKYYTTRILSMMEASFMFNNPAAHSNLLLSEKLSGDSLTIASIMRREVSRHFNFNSSLGYDGSTYERKLKQRIDDAPSSLEFVHPIFTIHTITEDAPCAE